MNKIRTERFCVVPVLAGIVGLSLLALTARPRASSSALAVGNTTSDHRPLAWKNRDSWSTPNTWQNRLRRHEATGEFWGPGDRYGDRFNYLGVNSTDSFDPITQQEVVWMGCNEQGLCVMQTAAHTLDGAAEHNQGLPVTQDPNGVSQGLFNRWLLSRAESVDEVEQIFRDTNDGGGFNNSVARNTWGLFAVFDRWGRSAYFEADGDSFTRDNTTIQDVHDQFGHYTAVHNDDKDGVDPLPGQYSGYDWRANFTRVLWTKPNGFQYFIDQWNNVVSGNNVILQCPPEDPYPCPDGINDQEDSASAVHRWERIGIRIDDATKDYKYFIQKPTSGYGLPTLDRIETVARSIGELPYNENQGQKSTGFHVNRFVTVSSAVAIGTLASEPYQGKLTAMWVALGEPAVTVFVPVFPFAGAPPTVLDDMYVHSNTKRHLVYSYTSDESTGYSSGRNEDHSIDTVALAGQNGYYGDGGIQAPIFKNERCAYMWFDSFMRWMRTTNFDDNRLRTELRNHQEFLATTLKTHYVNGTVWACNQMPPYPVPVIP